MRLHETRIVDRPLDEVFSFTADFSNADRWDPGVASSTKVGEGEVGMGTKYKVIVEFGSRRIPMDYETTAYEPNERVVLEGRGESVDSVDEIRFSAYEGATAVDYTADITFRNWMRFLDPVLSPFMQPIGRRALDGLVETLER